MVQINCNDNFSTDGVHVVPDMRIATDEAGAKSETMFRAWDLGTHAIAVSQPAARMAT